VRIGFLGTSDYAATVLRRLGESPYRPALVVTPPDRPRGRGRRLASPPAAETARDLGLGLLQAASVNDPEALARVREAELDLAVVCAFGQLIREPLLSELEMLNLHPSLLPRWRGAAPIERAIMAGDGETGVTMMRLTAGLDSGPIALQEPAPIEPRDDHGSLAARLVELGGELVLRGLSRYEKGELRFTEQDESRATYAEKIAPGERRLDPSRPAAELERIVRALTPHIGAFLELENGAQGARLGVREAFAVEGELESGVLAADRDALLLGCGEGALRLNVLQPPGGRAMPADAYLRGHPVPRLAS
jgi:methionyl-tRNA formyltransferase